jgi:thiamine biosynthesis lipoprotein
MPSAVSILPLLTLAAAPVPAETHRFHADHVLGTSLDMVIAGAREAEAGFAYAAARVEIARLDRILSGWREDSELAALNRAEGMAVSPELYAVVSACEAWRARTGGAFSARLGEAEQAWTAGGVPDPAALCATAQRAEAAALSLDPASRTIDPAGVRLAVDGLAKGYIIDAALDAAARAAPCASLMIDLGGDVACRGARSWTVGIADPAKLQDNAAPAAAARISNAALAVSGPGRRDRLAQGEAYSHLLDPKTGWPAPRVQAAVIAPRAADADALATALAVMPPEQGVKLASSLQGVEALILAADGARWETPGWSGYACAAPAAAAASVLEVSFELPRIDAANYRKPYVVVWVTDADKTLVKTLLILGKRASYQEDNYVWWRRYGRKQPEIVDTTAKPTRAPGRYAVGWDGTDAAGRAAAPGAYLIHIEAAREHGGHAYQTIPVTLDGAAGGADAAVKDELGATNVRYGRGK